MDIDKIYFLFYNHRQMTTSLKSCQKEVFSIKIYHFNELEQFHYYDLVSDDIGITKHTAALTEPLHGHDYYEIEYVYEGLGVQVINGTPYPVETGCIMLFDVTDVHSYYSLKDIAVYNCCFTRKNFMHHFSFESLHSPVVHLDSYFQLQIEQLLYLLENELRNKRTQYLDVAWTLLDLILLSIFRNEANPVLANTFWSPLLTNIATNYQTITLSEAADIMGVSVRHFCRLFKRDYNCTFHEYMKTIRIQQAKQQLLYSNKSIGELPEAVGYGNACSFFQDFKQIVGLTPYQYRSQMQNSPTFPSMQRICPPLSDQN